MEMLNEDDMTVASSECNKDQISIKILHFESFSETMSDFENEEDEMALDKDENFDCGS